MDALESSDWDAAFKILTLNFSLRIPEAIQQAQTTRLFECFSDNSNLEMKNKANIFINLLLSPQ